MNATEAVKKARDVSADRAAVAIHYGANKRKDRAVRITGTDKAGADEIGREIAEAIGGEYRYAAGFAAVWF